MTNRTLRKAIEFVLKRSIVDQDLLDVMATADKRGQMDTKKIIQLIAVILTHLLDETKTSSDL